MSDEPRAEFVDVNPALAQAWLQRNDKNRSVKLVNQAKLVRSIQQNEFMFTGDTIKFAPCGRLLDGQHRLMAIVQSGTTQRLLVVFNVPEEAFHVIDRGVGRSNGDMLAQMGVTHANTVAAAARLAISYAEARGGDRHFMSVDILPHQVRDEVSDNESLYREAASLALRAHRTIPGSNKSSLAALYVIVVKVRGRSDEVVDFIDGLATLEGLRRGDPRAALANAFASSVRPGSMHGGSRSNHWKLAMLIRTFNLWLDGAERKLLKFAPLGDKFPAVKPANESEVSQ